MIYGLLLAAGESRRFQADKLVHCLPEGPPIAVAAARCLRPAVDRLVAVVRPGNVPLEEMLAAEGCTIVHCARAVEGMGASLACGVRASSDAHGWVVALADMPYIRPETIQEVARRLRSGGAIIAPQWRGQRGHPVGFGARFYPELQALGGDAGARGVLSAHKQDIDAFETDDPGVIRDIDTPADLKA